MWEEGVWIVKDGAVRRWGEKGTGCGRDGKKEDVGCSRKGEGWEGGKIEREGNWRGKRWEEQRCRME